jgi:hypothetical protein
MRVPVLQGTTPVMTSLPNLVCADDTAHAAASVATARKKSALDAIAVGPETEQNAIRE